MHNSNVGAKREYKVAKFFKDRSKDISKAFFSETIKISTIRSRSIGSDTQEFSFRLKLLVQTHLNEQELHNRIFFKIKELIDFFKLSSQKDRAFKYIVKTGDKELVIRKDFFSKIFSVAQKEGNEPIWNILDEIGKYALSRKKYNAQEFGESLSIVEQSKIINIFLKGITVKLQADIADISLSGLNKVKVFLEEGIEVDGKTENQKQSYTTPQVEETKSGKELNVVRKESIQVVPVKGSFGYNVKNSRKQASIAIAAMCDNVSWFRSFFRLPDFDTVQFFFQQSPKLSAQKQQGQKCAENDQATRSHTEYFKANRKKSKKQSKKPLEEEKQLTIKQAQIDARVAMIDNHAEQRGKKLDEIFVEVVSGYKNQDPETFHDIFNSIFNIVYFQDKQLHEILELDEISKVLEILEIPQPAGKSSLPKEYLQKQVHRKKGQLLKLVSEPSPQPEHENRNLSPNKISPATDKAPPATNKSSLKNLFSSKKTYFCLFVIAASISILCLWHFPLGIKELVLPEKREKIGLVLNIGLPILITLCLFNLIYSEYSIKSVEQNKSLYLHL